MLARVLLTELAKDYLKTVGSFKRDFNDARRWILDQIVNRKIHDRKPLNALDCSSSREGDDMQNTEVVERMCQGTWDEMEKTDRMELMAFIKGKGKGKGKGWPSSPDRFEG